MMPFPVSGESRSTIAARLKAMRQKDVNWRGGRASLHAYFAGDEVMAVGKEAFELFMFDNALAPVAFPSLKQMENELIAASIDLFHGSSDAAGSVTTGGTESIILAIKAAKDRARADGYRDRTDIIAASTAHPAIEKAADLMGLRVRRTSVDANFRVDIAEMEAMLGEQTLLLVGSAPCLPFGVIDPIEAMGRLALEYDTWLHVDACIGGFIAPFATKLGYPVPPFDFALPGVCSISADLHKFGYAPKGASILLYRHPKDFECQPFSFSDWPKGLYETETLLGTRSGGPIAGAWAVIHFLGETGYLEVTKRVMDLRDRFIEGMEAIEGLALLTKPDLSVLSFAPRHLDVAAVCDEMANRGWYISRIAEPRGFQQTLNLIHEASLDLYLEDLASSVAYVREHAIVSSNTEVITY